MKSGFILVYSFVVILDFDNIKNSFYIMCPVQEDASEK